MYSIPSLFFLFFTSNLGGMRKLVYFIMKYPNNGIPFLLISTSFRSISFAIFKHSLKDEFQPLCYFEKNKIKYKFTGEKDWEKTLPWEATLLDKRNAKSPLPQHTSNTRSPIFALFPNSHKNNEIKNRK